MKTWFISPLEDLWPIAITTLAIYIALIICTRIAGKRSFSKLSSFDFAITVSIGSVIASTVLSASVTLYQGIIGLISLYAIQMLAAILRRFKWFRSAIDNSPLLLMDGEEIIQKNLKKSRVTEEDLRSKLREANVIELKQVKAVIFESTGDISVLHSSDTSTSIDDFLMKSVRK